MIKDFVFFFSGLVVLFIIMNSYHQLSGDMVYEKYKSRTFLVRNIKNPKHNKQQAAVKLDNVLNKLIKIKDYMITTFPTHPDVIQLKANFKANSISENLPDSEYTSYSLNKGEKIAMCIRSKKTNDFIDENTIMFVAIHEMAHIMTKSIGHKPEFWKNMRVLLCIGNKLKLYTWSDYSTPAKYCGTDINSTPLKSVEDCEDTIAEFKKEAE